MKLSCQQKGGGQFQSMDEDGKGSQWFQLMGPKECWEPMRTLLKHISLHEQVLVHDTIVLMEVE